TTVRHPAAAAVRTPWATTAGSWPSYRWTRPRNTSTRVAPIRTERTDAPWPAAEGGGNPGRSARATVAPSPSASAARLQPDPATTAAPTAPSSAASTVPPTVPPTTAAGAPSADHPARVLVIGDSDAGTFGPYLKQVLDETGVVSTTVDYKVSSGLARPDFFDW